MSCLRSMSPQKAFSCFWCLSSWPLSGLGQNCELSRLKPSFRLVGHTHTPGTHGSASGGHCRAKAQAVFKAEHRTVTRLGFASENGPDSALQAAQHLSLKAINAAMLQYFALPTNTGAAVCYASPTLGGAVVMLDCRTLQQAQHEAMLRNQGAARHPAPSLQPVGGQARRSARYFENEAAQ